MGTNLIKELNEAIAYDKKHNLGFYDGRATLVRSQYDHLFNKINDKIYSICVGYGVLPGPATGNKYYNLILSGKMAFTNAMNQFKKELYSI